MSDALNRIKFNPEHKRVIDTFLLRIPSVVPGKMFGYPAYYINKKLFACIYENGVGLKVPEELANQLVNREGVTCFRPLGRRKMRRWIYINRERSEDYLKDQFIFESSVRFVSSLGAKVRVDS